MTGIHITGSHKGVVVNDAVDTNNEDDDK